MSDGFPWAQSTKYRMTFYEMKLPKNLTAMLMYGNDTKKPWLGRQNYRTSIPLKAVMKEMTRLNLTGSCRRCWIAKTGMSMYHGLEVRVPFAINALLNIFIPCPGPSKDYEHREKGYFASCYGRLLPEKSFGGKKAPYPKTHHPAYLAAVSQLMEDVLADANAPIFDIIKPEALRDLLDHDMKYPWYKATYDESPGHIVFLATSLCFGFFAIDMIFKERGGLKVCRAPLSW